MKQDSYLDIIQDLTERALWEVKNIIDCVPDDLWDKCYCQMPMWKHIYAKSSRVRKANTNGII